MTTEDKDRLAGYHHTISEQLNSRLSESPKFFGLLVVVATGYGYVLSNEKFSCNTPLFLSASVLLYGVILWASWYLAALSYGFRFLQNIQHCVEHALKWNPRFVPQIDKKPSPRWKLPSVPSIYHPHAVGLLGLLLIVCAIFGYHARQYWRWALCCVWFSIAGLFVIGSMIIGMLYAHYQYKFERKCRNPAECDIYSA